MSEMKKKVRNNQYQSSRLYLRKKDHRDLVFNDIYHNAMQFKQDDDERVKWHKYKPKLLLGSIGGRLTSIDVVNQIVHVGNESAYDNYRILQLKDYMIASFISGGQYQQKEILISKNGHDWYQAFLSNKKTYDWISFGDTNSFVYPSRSGNWLEIYKCTVEEDEETGALSISEDGLMTRRLFTAPSGTDPLNYYYALSRTSNGALICAGAYSNFDFWNVTEDGFELMVDIPRNGYINMLGSTNRYAHYGDGKAVYPFCVDTSSALVGQISAKVVVVENGVGTVYTVDEITCWAEAVTYQYYHVIHKNGKWWFYWYRAIPSLDSSYHTVWHKKLAVYETENFEEWIEHEQPDFITVDLVETTFQSNVVGDKIRIILNSDYTPLLDGMTNVAPRFDYLSSGYGMEFKDSLIDGKWGDIEPIIAFPLTNGFYVTFDNMIWQVNDNTFAFGTNTISGYAEPIQHGDYCYP